MAVYTILNQDAVINILAEFAIHDFTSFEVLNGGYENTNYLVIADTKKFVLTICENKSKEKLEEIARILEYLKNAGFYTSEIVYSRQGRPISVWNAKPVMLKVFLEGKIMEDLPSHLIELIGKEMGVLHQVRPPDNLPRQMGYGKEQFYLVDRYAANSPFAYWIKEIQDYMKPYFAAELPKAFIHGDIFADNVIVSEDESAVTIMDFEESTYYYRVYDLGMAIIGSCVEGKKINLNKSRSLLKGYQREIQLLDRELKALQAFTVYAGASMTFWRFINFNYTNPDPKMTDHYLGLKVLVDYVRDLPVGIFEKNIL